MPLCGSNSHLDLNGTELSISALRWIAELLEQTGELHITGCKVQYEPGKKFEMLGKYYVLKEETFVEGEKKALEEHKG